MRRLVHGRAVADKVRRGEHEVVLLRPRVLLRDHEEGQHLIREHARPVQTAVDQLWEAQRQMWRCNLVDNPFRCTIALVKTKLLIDGM